VSARQRRASEAIAPAVDEPREFVRWHEGVKNVDETTWYQRGADGSNEDGRGAFVWVAATGPVTVYDIALSRGQNVAEGLLGEVMSVMLVSDRYSGYRYINNDKRAHLYRDFVRISERRGKAGGLGQNYWPRGIGFQGRGRPQLVDLLPEVVCSPISGPSLLFQSSSKYRVRE
jgi:hypothetical protein